MTKMKRMLSTECGELASLKFKQGVGIKAMGNDYMVLNRLQEEKAQYLRDVHLDVINNT